MTNKPRSIKWYHGAKWISFACAIFFAFVPSIIAIAVTFPLTNADNGSKIAVGGVVLLINVSSLLIGILRLVKVKFPLINWVALIDIIMCIVHSEFSEFNASLEICEVIAFVGSIAFAIFWYMFRKYSAQLLTAKTNKEMGLI